MQVAKDCEIWGFIEAFGGTVHDSAAGIASEVKRLADLATAKACGFTFDMTVVSEMSKFGPTKFFVAVANGNEASPETCAAAISFLAKKYRPALILFASTPFGEEVGARVAVELEAPFVASCVDFEVRDGRLFARRKVCQGKANAVVELDKGELPAVVVVDAESLEAVSCSGQTSTEMVVEEVRPLRPRIRMVKQWKVPSSELDVAEARIVVGIGRGVSPEVTDSIFQLAEMLGAAVGGSKLAVDKGLVPRERQIGASGKWIKSDIYIACGISGASHHMMGIRDVKHLVAINCDESAPILRHAELGVLGDVGQVVPSIIQQLSTSKGLAQKGVIAS